MIMQDEAERLAQASQQRANAGVLRAWHQIADAKRREKQSVQRYQAHLQQKILMQTFSAWRLEQQGNCLLKKMGDRLVR